MSIIINRQKKFVKFGIRITDCWFYILYGTN